MATKLSHGKEFGIPLYLYMVKRTFPAMHSEVHKYLDSDPIFMALPLFNEFEMTQSRCDWSVESALFRGHINCFEITAI